MREWPRMRCTFSIGMPARGTSVAQVRNESDAS
jgi:hypothetical protein